MLSHLKIAVDDASDNSRTKVGAIYALLLALNGFAWTWQ